MTQRKLLDGGGFLPALFGLKSLREHFGFIQGINPPIRALPPVQEGLGHPDEVPVQRKVVPDGVLPTLLLQVVVGVVLADEAVDAVQGDLTVLCRSNGLSYQLSVGEGWFGVVLGIAIFGGEVSDSQPEGVRRRFGYFRKRRGT